jgi:hypothetical protein
MGIALIMPFDTSNGSPIAPEDTVGTRDMNELSPSMVDSRDLGHMIVPKPQFIDDKGFTLVLDGDWRIVTETSDPDYTFSCSWFNQMVTTTGGLNIPILDMSSMPASRRILIGDPTSHNTMRQALERRNRSLPDVIGNEGYLLEVYDDQIAEIIIWANTPNGAFYGVTSLIQLIGLNASLPAVFIVDYPEHKIRGAYEPGSIRLEWTGTMYRFTPDNRAFIDWLAMHKFNTVMTVGHGDFFKDNSVWLEAYTDLFAYARERFIEPIPRLSTISTVTDFTYEYWEGWPIYNEHFTFDTNDVAVPNIPYVELITNGDFEIDADSDEHPDDWTVISQTGATWGLDDTVAFSGTHSMRLDVPFPTANSDSAYLRRTFHGIKPNSYYCVWSKARAMDIESIQPKLTIYIRDSVRNTIVSQSDVTWSTVAWINFGACIKSPENASDMVVYARLQNPGTGTLWLDDFHLYRVNGGLRNMLRSNDLDLNVTDLTGQIEYVKDLDYEVINGAVNMRHTWDLAPFEVKRLQGGSISPGEEVLITWDTWLFYQYSKYWVGAPCVAKEELYTDYIFPGIDNILDHLDPKIINIDLDEVRGFYRDRRMLDKFNDPGEAFAYYSNRIDDYVVAKCPDCRLWIWDDMVSPYHNGGSNTYQINYGGQPGRGATATEKDLMSKNVIQDIWWYDDARLAQMWHSVKYFREKGYDVMGSPWLSDQNIISWSEILLDQPHSLGGIETNWGTPWEDAHTVFADNFWNTRYKLLLFSSFEDPGVGYSEPSGWEFHGNALYSTDGSNNQGTNYVDFPNCAINMTAGQSAWSRRLSVRPNTVYNLSAYVKRDDPADTNRPTTRVNWFDDMGELISFEVFDVLGVTDEYLMFDFDATSPPRSRSANIGLQGPSGGADVIWYDTVRFKEETVFLGIIGPYSLDDGFINVSYSSCLEAAGGIGEYAWTIINGLLPDGLFLLPDGHVFGIPREEGTFNFMVEVTDEALRTDTKNFNITVI